ncbi:UNVERIFIED_CONTAM: hypothetical protein Sradi_0217300 [Sesamum radiatum]|uniref:Uncharacterized protein n=1 Tax=Sesamum radiatum TaxID=300843 RepID=A0AAW2VZK4_SESRA
MDIFKDILEFQPLIGLFSFLPFFCCCIASILLFTIWGSVRFPSGIGRDMLENRRDNHLLSRETASPTGGVVASGRGSPRPECLDQRQVKARCLDQPRLGAGRGVPRPASPGRGDSPRPGVAPVAPLLLSLSFASGENIDFHDEVIESIRNLPESYSDSLEF